MNNSFRPKLIKTPLGHFEVVQWNGINESGIVPFLDRVLIFPDQAATASPGGIVLPEELHHRLTQAAETGVLIAMGDDAWLWNSDRSRRYEGAKPSIGTRVVFERYAGSFHEAPDGRWYRLMDDKCVAGIYSADFALTDKVVPQRTRPKANGSGVAQVTKPPLVVAR